MTIVVHGTLEGIRRDVVILERAFGCRCTCVHRAVYCWVYSLDKTRNIYVTTEVTLWLRDNRREESGRGLVPSQNRDSLQSTIVRDNQRG